MKEKLTNGAEKNSHLVMLLSKIHRKHEPSANTNRLVMLAMVSGRLVELLGMHTTETSVTMRQSNKEKERSRNAKKERRRNAEKERRGNAKKERNSNVKK